jgi:hypothetical protein
MISEWLTGQDVEKSERGLILMYYPSIWLQGLRKTMLISVTIAGLRVEIRTRDLPSIKQGC